jgi:hypothetical protein
MDVHIDGMTANTTLPSSGLLVLYWIPSVGIGNPTQTVAVPLSEILNYPLPGVVNLGAATFNSASAPYITIPDDIQEQLTNGSVRQLQSAGVKVLLSVLGGNGIGWDDVTEHLAFAAWVRTALIDQYGLDGIDIDNEAGGPANVQNFMNTVGCLREALFGKLLTKALWDDEAYFKAQVGSGYPNAGASLANLLDFGSTMDYGWSLSQQQGLVTTYNGYGLPNDRICIGVQAGPPEQNWMTPIEEVAQLAQWSVQVPILGMMLYTFSQDIQQFTASPQNSIPYPNANDHEWQRTIQSGMGVPQAR